jgi:hypothetical protein
MSARKSTSLDEANALVARAGKSDFCRERRAREKAARHSQKHVITELAGTGLGYLLQVRPGATSA